MGFGVIDNRRKFLTVSAQYATYMGRDLQQISWTVAIDGEEYTTLLYDLFDFYTGTVIPRPHSGARCLATKDILRQAITAFIYRGLDGISSKEKAWACISTARVPGKVPYDRPPGQVPFFMFDENTKLITGLKNIPRWKFDFQVPTGYSLSEIHDDYGVLKCQKIKLI